MTQSSSEVFLIQPAQFGFNPDTAATNDFQQVPPKAGELQQNVLNEFQGVVRTLKDAGVQVHVFEDTPEPVKPDAIFPNNWISLHADGTLVLYPMCSPNRRWERRLDIVQYFKQSHQVNRILDFSEEENRGAFLEGTGSIVFDHVERIAYGCLSPRTHLELFHQVCESLGYEPVVFRAYGNTGKPIYHTNVMMSIAHEFAVVCFDAIPSRDEQHKVQSSLLLNHREVIALSREQMNCFAGNMLALKNTDGENLLAISQTAWKCINHYQRGVLEQSHRILCMNIPTIESVGGGSVRCMIAEVFTPKRSRIE